MSKPSRLYVNNYYRNYPNDTADNFTVTLPQAIINATSMSINSASLTFLCYTFATAESIFYYQCGSTVVKKFTLNLKKVYNTIDSFIVDFQALFPVADGVTVSKSTDGTESLILTSANGISVIGIAQKEYNWDQTYFNNCSDRLGFYNGTLAPLSAAPTATIFAASAPVTLLRTSCIYVACDVVGGDSFTTNTASQSISAILFQIPLSSSGTFGSVISYFNSDYSLFSGSQLPNVIYNVNIILYDDVLNPLELLPSARICLELSFKYDKSDSQLSTKLSQ